MAQLTQRSPPGNVALVLLWPGTICRLHLLLVLAFLRRLFFLPSGSPFLTRPQYPTLQIPFRPCRRESPHQKPAAKADMAFSLNIVIYLVFLATEKGILVNNRFSP